MSNVTEFNQAIGNLLHQFGLNQGNDPENTEILIYSHIEDKEGNIYAAGEVAAIKITAYKRLSDKLEGYPETTK